MDEDRIELEPTICSDCGLWVYISWPEGWVCESEDCGVEHECNPDTRMGDWE